MNLNYITRFAAIGMTALALAAPAFAETNEGATSTMRTVNVACMQAAIEKRDSAIISAHNAANTSITTALSARKDALKAAWGQTDRKTRRSALHDAWKAWMTTSKQARTTFKTARDGAWTTFASDRKTCGTGAMNDDSTNRGADAHL